MKIPSDLREAYDADLPCLVNIIRLNLCEDASSCSASISTVSPDDLSLFFDRGMILRERWRENRATSLRRSRRVPRRHRTDGVVNVGAMGS